MKEINVKNLKHFSVVALMFVIGLLAIASNAAVWNAVAGGAEAVGASEVVFSVLNLITLVLWKESFTNSKVILKI